MAPPRNKMPDLRNMVVNFNFHATVNFEKLIINNRPLSPILSDKMAGVQPEEKELPGKGQGQDEGKQVKKQEYQKDPVNEGNANKSNSEDGSVNEDKDDDGKDDDHTNPNQTTPDDESLDSDDERVSFSFEGDHYYQDDSYSPTSASYDDDDNSVNDDTISHHSNAVPKVSIEVHRRCRHTPCEVLCSSDKKLVEHETTRHFFCGECKRHFGGLSAVRDHMRDSLTHKCRRAMGLEI